ncbi:MAG: glycine cleavage system protein GcvH [Anaerosomatales bacterium]|nr:glycine cleavage system protein GcvH [Anaerosomatales bacterium]
MYPSDLKYDREHEWVRLDGDVATIGITHYAQDQLGEVVYVDLPSVGDEAVAGESFGEIESVKSVSELFSPVSGEIVEVNGALAGAPELVNESPYEDGWMIKVRVADAATALDGLMTADEYEAFIAGEA